MPETITLYRGDAEKIATFLLDKTDKSALFGIGIYLTDSKLVASDYTVKSRFNVVFTDNDTRQGDHPAKTTREFIRRYLEHQVDEQFGGKTQQEELKRHYQNLYYALPRDDQDGKDRIQKEYADKLAEERKKLLKKVAGLLKQQLPDMRIMRNTQGYHYLIKEAGHVTAFEVPVSYAAKTFDGDAPLEDRVLEIIAKMLDKYQNGRGDFRDLDDKFHLFRDWIGVFKKQGSRYAWRDDTVGGTGQNPSLDEIKNGTHGGFGFFYDLDKQKEFITACRSLGYVGIRYEGGKRVGANIRGLGGHRHTAYCFWDVPTVQGFMTGQTPHEGEPVDPKWLQRLR